MRIAMLALPGAAMTSIFGPLEILDLASHLAKQDRPVRPDMSAELDKAIALDKGIASDVAIVADKGIDITLVTEEGSNGAVLAGSLYRVRPLAKELRDWDGQGSTREAPERQQRSEQQHSRQQQQSERQPQPEGRYDWVLVSAAGHPGSAGFGFSPTLLEWVRGQHDGGAHLASICTGAFLLAEAGVLEHQDATTHWLFEKRFRDRYPGVRLRIDQLLTRGDRVMCSGGAYAGLDLALAIVVDLFGKDLANRCAKLLLLDRHRGSQSVYAGLDARWQHGDARVRAVQEWLDEHYAEAIQIEQLAVRANLGERHFKRRFKAATGEAPLVYLQKLRIDKARKLLECSPVPVEEVARAVGYEDAGFFRELFRRLTSQTPAQYRHHYR